MKTTISAEEVIQGLTAHLKDIIELAEAYEGHPPRKMQEYLVSEINYPAAEKAYKLAEQINYAIHCVEEMNRQGVNRFDF